jgi:hypothetical protein
MAAFAVYGQSGRGNHPCDRTYVYDGSPSGFDHSGNNRLDQKKLMAKIHGHTIVPVFRSDVFQPVPIVVPYVVDKHTNCAQFTFDVVNDGPNPRNIAKIAGPESGQVRAAIRQLTQGHSGAVRPNHQSQVAHCFRQRDRLEEAAPCRPQAVFLSR